MVQEPMVTSNNMRKYAEFVYKYKGKAVNIVLEFPAGADEKAKSEFTDLLKNVYLERMKETYKRKDVK